MFALVFLFHFCSRDSSVDQRVDVAAGLACVLAETTAATLQAEKDAAASFQAEENTAAPQALVTFEHIESSEAQAVMANWKRVVSF